MRITDNIEDLKKFLEELEHEERRIKTYNEDLLKYRTGYPLLYMWDYHYEDNPYKIMGIIRREIRVRNLREEILSWILNTKFSAGSSIDGYDVRISYLYKDNGELYRYKNRKCKLEKISIEFHVGSYRSIEKAIDKLPMNHGDIYLMKIRNVWTGKSVKDYATVN